MPPIASFFTNLFNKQGGSLISGISDIIKDWKVTPEQQTQIEKEINRHIEAVTTLSQAADDIYIKDVQSARALQIEALKQNDNFSKRFVYWLALGVIILTFGFDFCLFAVKFPPENKDILNMVTGVLNTSCLVMVISFFFGSSKSSSDKQATIDNLTNGKA